MGSIEHQVMLAQSLGIGYGYRLPPDNIQSLAHHELLPSTWQCDHLGMEMLTVSLLVQVNLLCVSRGGVARVGVYSHETLL